MYVCDERYKCLHVVALCIMGLCVVVDLWVYSGGRVGLGRRGRKKVVFKGVSLSLRKNTLIELNVVPVFGKF